MIFPIGPFTFYRCERTGTLDVMLTRFQDQAWGWEYGYRDDMRGSVDKPLVQFRIGKLLILYYEPFKNGSYEAWFFGFWWFGKGDKDDKN